jgi:hypothetical protein
MKRRRRLPMFQSLEPPVYVIDTSAWLNIDSRPDSEDVWQLIVDLINEERIIACARVLGELRDQPIYMLRLKPFEAALQSGDRQSNDVDYLMHVGKVAHKHPGMSRAVGRKTPADPYVVALAELENCIVVCDESNKRPSRKIPGVCQMRGIQCLTLDQFIAKEKK